MRCSLACLIMNHCNTSLHPDDPSLLRPEDLVICMDDYVRLRALVGDHALADELDRAIVVPADRIPANVVTMNTRLIYVDERTGMQREVELVYPEDADSVTGKVSVLAPVGCALLGLSTGESIDWSLPSGQVHRLRVERILFQPQSVAPDSSGTGGR